MQQCTHAGPFFLRDGFLHLLVDYDAWGNGVWARLKVVPTPRELAAAYSSMYRATDLSCAPRLVVVTSAGGAGGLFMPGLIVVGREDALTIARRMWRQEHRRLRSTIAGYLLRHGIRTRNYLAFLEMAVLGRIVAHELGHALVYEGHETPFDHPEAAADYLAGRLDAARGREGRIGEAIFRGIGCRELICSHPSPHGRALAYASGYRFQAEVA